jgi:hypothetical protein
MSKEGDMNYNVILPSIINYPLRLKVKRISEKCDTIKINME